MSAQNTLRTIANELPGILRQLDSADPLLGAAAVQRLRDFADMTEPLRAAGMGAKRVSRRGLLRAGAGVTFAAMAFKDD